MIRTLLVLALQADDLAILAARLSAEDVELRDAACSALKSAGERAVPLLLAAAASDDPERRARAFQLLSRLEKAPEVAAVSIAFRVDDRRGSDLVDVRVTLVNRGRTPVLINRSRIQLRGLDLTRPPPEGFESLAPGDSAWLSFEGILSDAARVYVVCRGIRPAEPAPGSTECLRLVSEDPGLLADLLNTLHSAGDAAAAPALTAVADLRTRHLVLTGTAEGLKGAREVVADLDRSPDSGEFVPFRTRHGNLADALEALLRPWDRTDQD